MEPQFKTPRPPGFLLVVDFMLDKRFFVHQHFTTPVDGHPEFASCEAAAVVRDDSREFYADGWHGCVNGVEAPSDGGVRTQIDADQVPNTNVANTHNTGWDGVFVCHHKCAQ